jgi:hypothetical protein
MACKRVLAEALLNQSTEAVKAFTQVRGPSAKKDSDGRGEHGHDAGPVRGTRAISATTCLSHSGSGGASRRSRTSCSSSTSTVRSRAGSACECVFSGWSATSRGASEAGEAGRFERRFLQA